MGMLHIEAERRAEEKSEEKGYARHELRYESFGRNLALPEGVSGSAITPSYKDGILEIRIPAPEPAKKIPSRQELTDAARRVNFNPATLTRPGHIGAPAGPSPARQGRWALLRVRSLRQHRLDARRARSITVTGCALRRDFALD